MVWYGMGRMWVGWGSGVNGINVGGVGEWYGMGWVD